MTKLYCFKTRERIIRGKIVELENKMIKGFFEMTTVERESYEYAIGRLLKLIDKR